MAMYACLLLLFRSVHFISGRWWRRRHIGLCLLPNDFLLCQPKNRNSSFFSSFWITLLDLPRLPMRGRFTVVEWCSLLITRFASNILRAGSRRTCGALTLPALPSIEPWQSSSGSRMERFSINLKGRVVDDTDWMMRRFNASQTRRRKLQKKTHQRPLPSCTKPFTVKCH